MTTQLDIVRDGPLGVITLNRPEAINALSLEMIEGITATLSSGGMTPHSGSCCSKVAARAASAPAVTYARYARRCSTGAARMPTAISQPNTG